MLFTTTSRLLRPTATRLACAQPAALRRAVGPSVMRFHQSAMTRKEDDQVKKVASEIVESLLYGSKKIKEEESQTHSKKLARGKYVHELQSKSEGTLQSEVARVIMN